MTCVSPLTCDVTTCVSFLICDVTTCVSPLICDVTTCFTFDLWRDDLCSTFNLWRADLCFTFNLWRDDLFRPDSVCAADCVLNIRGTIAQLVECRTERPGSNPRGGKRFLSQSTSNANSKHWFTTITAVFSYVIGFWKLSANEQFFIGAQTVISLLQKNQIKQGVSFIAANKVYTSANKTPIVWIETELFFLFFYPGWMRLTCLGAK